MKKFKSFMLVAAMSAFALTSCDDDDTGSTPSIGGSTLNELSGVISEDMTLTADKVWILDGRVTVSGATLTIEPGTVIKGNPGAGAISSVLIIARDGKIMANGTAAEPIIFTSIADDVESGNVASPNMDAENNGLWGGVIILGQAPISASTSPAQIDGIPTSDQNGLYGGTDPAHSSGEFTYVSIRHGGTAIAPGNEINGLTLGGVGSGTKIHHIEVVANQDDGIEWFGGTVNVSDVIVWNPSDDGLDTDQDWTGTCDNFIVIGARDGGSAMELDGPEGPSATGTHYFKNGTVYAGDDVFSLVDWDANTNAALQNVYFYGLAAGYGYAPSTADKKEVQPFASYGGDESGVTSGIEIKLNGGTLANLFKPGTTLPTSLKEVTTPTVGANFSEFSGWSWAQVSGELDMIQKQ